MVISTWLLLACSTQELKETPPPTPKIVEVVVEELEEIEPEIVPPPQFESMDFKHLEPKTTDSIEIIVKSKRAVSGSIRKEYEWKINEKKIISERSPTLSRSQLKKGDVISVTVTLRNGEQKQSKTMQTRIVNSPPQWERDPRLVREIDGFTVKAIDPDGDPILYRLEGQPDGMSISSKGVLRYKGSTTEKGGTYNIIVIGEDTEKALVKWNFSINLSAGSDAPK